VSRLVGLGIVPGFIIAGVFVGPSVLGLINNQSEITHLAELGAGLNINRKYPLQPLCPGHGHTAFEGSFLFTLLVRAGFSSPAPPGWSDKRILIIQKLYKYILRCYYNGS
jgi:hypothetical protein